MATQKVLAAGNISEEAANWLIAHECEIETSQGLSIIWLSIEAEVSPSNVYEHEYVIAFYDEEGEYEETSATVSLEIDAYETRIVLKKPVGPDGDMESRLARQEAQHLEDKQFFSSLGGYE